MVTMEAIPITTRSMQLMSHRPCTVTYRKGRSVTTPPPPPSCESALNFDPILSQSDESQTFFMLSHRGPDNSPSVLILLTNQL